MVKKETKQKKQKNKTKSAKSKVLKKKKINRANKPVRKKEDIVIDKDFTIDVNDRLKIETLYDDIDDDTGEDLLI
jgi:hypothetical protein